MTPFVYVQIVGMFHILEREILESEYEATGPDESATFFVFRKHQAKNSACLLVRNAAAASLAQQKHAVKVKLV